MPHVTTNLTLQLQSLLLSRLRKLPLKRILLPTIPTLLPQTMVTLTLRQRPTLPHLIQRNRMSLMLLTPWTIRLNLFGNIHPTSRPTLHKEATPVLILFRPPTNIPQPTSKTQTSALPNQTQTQPKASITLKSG